MPVQTEHRFPLDLSVLDAAGNRVTLVDLRGQARAVAVCLTRTGTLPGVHSERPCPGPPASCDTGSRPRRPRATSTAQRCRPRSTGSKAPTILPQRAAKG